MVAKVSTVALNGIDAREIEVQVQVAKGMASFNIVGMPDGPVRESRERIRSAFQSMSVALPAKRITVNLSPADLRKDGSHYDLPIAVGLLIALGALPKDAADNAMFMGELSLDGNLSPVAGCLPAAIHANSKQKESLFVPIINAKEAAWAEGVSVFGVNTLKNLMLHLKGDVSLTPEKAEIKEARHLSFSQDFNEIKGQESAKRAAEIAAAGGHNMIMSGPPGAGKSMIAHRLPSILPPLNAEEALDVSMVHSVAGIMDTDCGLVTNRPFRDPHHSASAVALCGGGLKAKPGEMSLAHHGILFLDELAEFPRQVLETLRQPLETGNVTVSRANHHVTYPARFQLIAAMNPCPCGYLGHPSIGCKDSPRQVQNYQNKISGPLLDRFDMHVQVGVVDLKDLNLPKPEEGSVEMRSRVTRARILQKERFGDGKTVNAHMSPQQIEKFARATKEANNMLVKAGESMNLSARAFHRVLRVARTIADLNTSPEIQVQHIAEALSFRGLNA